MKRMLSLSILIWMLFHAAASATAHTLPPGDAFEPNESSPFIGFWQASDVVADTFAERYAFFHDGAFIYGYSEFDGLEQVCYKSGVWRVADGFLTLTVHKRLLLTDGHIVEDDEFGVRLESAEVLLESLDPPLLEQHTIRVAGFAPGALPETIRIDDLIYCDSDLQFDLMDGYFLMLADAFQNEERTFGFGLGGDSWVRAFAERASHIGLSLDKDLERFDVGGNDAEATYSALSGDIELFFHLFGGAANDFEITLDLHDLPVTEHAQALRTFQHLLEVAVYTCEGGGPPEVVDEIVRTLCRGFDGVFPEHFSAVHVFGTLGDYNIRIHPCGEDDEIIIEMYGEGRR